MFVPRSKSCFATRGSRSFCGLLDKRELAQWSALYGSLYLSIQNETSLPLWETHIKKPETPIITSYLFFFLELKKNNDNE